MIIFCFLRNVPLSRRSLCIVSITSSSPGYCHWDTRNTVHSENWNSNISLWSTHNYITLNTTSSLTINSIAETGRVSSESYCFRRWGWLSFDKPYVHVVHVAIFVCHYKIIHITVFVCHEGDIHVTILVGHGLVCKDITSNNTVGWFSSIVSENIRHGLFRLNTLNNL